MSTKIQFKQIAIIVGAFFFLLVALLLVAYATKARAAEPSCSIDLGKRVSIDVTDVKPHRFFEGLSHQAGCSITVSPLVWKHVTLHVKGMQISRVLDSVCTQINCKYIYNAGQLSIQPLTIIDNLRARQWEQFNKSMEERNRVLQSRLPEDMTFEDVPLSSVLDEISKVSGLVIKPWKDEGDRKVTLDVSSMTIEEAIKAVLIYVDGEGAVLIEQKYFLHHSWGQYWPWGYPPTQ
jgi:hypothetical protein